MTEERPWGVTKNRHEWLKDHKPIKVYNAPDRNDGMCVFRNRGMTTKGTFKGQEYDKITFVPFYEGTDKSVFWKANNHKIRTKTKDGKPISRTRKEYPLISLNKEAARELAKTILKVAEEQPLTVSEIEVSKESAEVKERMRKVRTIGV